MKEPYGWARRPSVVAGGTRNVFLTGKVTVRSDNGKNCEVDQQRQESGSFFSTLGVLGTLAAAVGLIESCVKHAVISALSNYPLNLAAYSYLDFLPTLPVAIVAMLLTGCIAWLPASTLSQCSGEKDRQWTAFGIIAGVVIGFVGIFVTLFLVTYYELLTKLCFYTVIAFIFAPTPILECLFRKIYPGYEKIIKVDDNGSRKRASSRRVAFCGGMPVGLRSAIYYIFLFIPIAIYYAFPETKISLIVIVLIAICVVPCLFYKTVSEKARELRSGDVDSMGKVFIFAAIMLTVTLFFGLFDAVQSNREMSNLFFVPGAGQEHVMNQPEDDEQKIEYKIMDIFADGRAIIDLGRKDVDGYSGDAYRLVSLDEGTVFRRDG